jgi:hypothetical protein
VAAKYYQEKTYENEISENSVDDHDCIGLCSGTSLYAQGTDSRIGSYSARTSGKGGDEATPITKADAEKKYPSKSGTYPSALATRMILPALFPAHIRRMKSITARKLTTAGWCRHVRSKSLFIPNTGSTDKG